MTISNLPKSVRFFPQERLELIDINALQSLARDLIANETLCTMGDTTYGWVIQGFDYLSAAGFTFNFDVTIPAVAIDSSGRLLISPTSSALSFTAPADGTYYLYAYVVDAADNLDNRMKWDSTTAAEVSINDQTRYTPVVGIHGSTTGSLTSLSLLGVTVPLVSLWEVVFVGGNLTGSTDLRSPLRAVNLIDSEVITARSSLKAGGGTATTLQNRIEQARAASMVIGDSTFSPASQGEYNLESGLRTALNNTTDGSGLAYIKRGLYPLTDNISITSQSGFRIMGDPPGDGIASFTGIPGTKITLTGAGYLFTFEACNGVIVDGLEFNFTGISEWSFIVNGCSNLSFVNCTFVGVAGSTRTAPMFDFKGTNQNVSFEKCNFVDSSSGGMSIFNFFETGIPSSMTNFLVSNCVFTTRANILNVNKTGVGTPLLSTFTSIWSGNTISSDGTGATYKFIEADFNRVVEGVLTITNNKFYNLANPSLTSFVEATAQTPTFTTNVCVVRIGDNLFRGETAESHVSISSYNGESYFQNNNILETIQVTPASLIYYHLGGLSNASGVQIRGNKFDLETTGSLAIKIDSAAGADTTLPGSPGLYISGNVIRDAKQGIEVLEPTSMSELLINHNTFSNVDSCCVNMQLQTTSPSTYQIRNLQLNGNIIQGGGNNGFDLYAAPFSVPVGMVNPDAQVMRPAFCLQGQGGVENLSIGNNQFTSWASSSTGTDHSPYQAIYLHLGDSRSISVNQNVIGNLGYTQASFTLAAKVLCGGIVSTIWYNNLNYDSMSINSNNILLTGYGAGILIDAGIDNAGIPIGSKRLQVSNNMITIDFPSSITATGIFFEDAFYTKVSTIPLNYLQTIFSSNMLSYASSPDAASYTDYLFDLDNISLKNSLISGNVVSTGGNGLKARFSPVTENLVMDNILKGSTPKTLVGAQTTGASLANLNVEI